MSEGRVVEDIINRLRARPLPVVTDQHALMYEAAQEIERLREKCNSRTRWLQSCMRARYEHLTDGAQEFADALFDEELEPEPPEVK